MHQTTTTTTTTTITTTKGEKKRKEEGFTRHSNGVCAPSFSRRRLAVPTFSKPRLTRLTRAHAGTLCACPSRTPPTLPATTRTPTRARARAHAHTHTVPVHLCICCHRRLRAHEPDLYDAIHKLCQHRPDYPVEIAARTFCYSIEGTANRQWHNVRKLCVRDHARKVLYAHMGRGRGSGGVDRGSGDATRRGCRGRQLSREKKRILPSSTYTPSPPLARSLSLSMCVCVCVNFRLASVPNPGKHSACSGIYAGGPLAAVRRCARYRLLGAAVPSATRSADVAIDVTPVTGRRYNTHPLHTLLQSLTAAIPRGDEWRSTPHTSPRRPQATPPLIARMEKEPHIRTYTCITAA